MYIVPIGIVLSLPIDPEIWCSV